MNLSVLALQPDTLAHASLRSTLTAAGCEVAIATTPEALRGRLAAHPHDVALLDIAGGDGGAELIRHVLRQGGSHAVVGCGRDQGLAAVVAAIRAGAADYLPLPLAGAQVREVLARAAGLPGDGDAATRSLQAWRREHAPGFVGDDARTLELLRLIRRVADTQCDVLITGASGTGKELVARCIHNASRRARQPFVALNCAAIPRDLMESEVFGHARGAFTGASERRGGKFEAAAGGTLFLDEVGEMDLGLQSKFLRVVQEREVTPVGDNRCIKVDVRIISATNQDLHGLCADKLFREDLYYRLNVIEVALPPLHARPRDIPELVAHFLQRANARHGRHVKGLERGAMDALCGYAWPGNVRELQNLVERLVVLKAAEGAIGADELPLALRHGVARAQLAPARLPEHGLDINEVLTGVETRLTLDALQRARGNKARAAELLGLKRTTLVERLKKLNLEAPAAS